jgi:hypothetical protein
MKTLSGVQLSKYHRFGILGDGEAMQSEAVLWHFFSGTGTASMISSLIISVDAVIYLASMIGSRASTWTGLASSLAWTGKLG